MAAATGSEVTEIEGDEAEERRRTATSLLVLGSLLLVVAVVVSVALQPDNLLGHAPYAALLVVHLVALALLRRGVVAPTVFGFAAAFLLITLGAMARAGGLLAPAGFVLPPLVLFVGLCHSGRAALATAGVSAAGVLGLVELARHGALPTSPSPTAIRLWLVATVSLVITGAMLHTALRIIRESRTRALAAVRAREELEERLVRSRRIEAVGRLAAGVAHDFNNVLTVVFAEASRLRKDPDPRVAASAASIREAAERAAALTRQLLSFGRRQLRTPERLDLREVTGKLSRLLVKYVGEDVKLDVRADPEPAFVLADRTEVEQLLLNLVTNARDAMPHGGTLTVHTGLAPASLRARCPAVAGDGAVYLEVTDTGVGIDGDTRAHLFEPFFTTKELGKGTGLGLATVDAIVKSAGGAVLVDSEPGRGSTFTVVLPEATAATATVARPATEPPVTPATAHVVVVDDDPLVRAAIQAVIADGGHQVSAFGSGAEVLAAAARWPRPPELLLTDVVMADMPGPELARRLRALHPGLRVLFTSGYAEDRLSERGVMAEGVHFLAKPFERGQLLAKIADVLASDNLGATGRAETARPTAPATAAPPAMPTPRPPT